MLFPFSCLDGIGASEGCLWLANLSSGSPPNTPKYFDSHHQGAYDLVRRMQEYLGSRATRKNESGIAEFP